MSPRDTRKFVALSGGIGGAKLSLGLAHLLGQRLTVIANTGDDFVHLGLHISPDVDTTLYTLGNIVNPEMGWGRRDETWSFMQAVADLGSPTWFNLGDKDLATHVERTRRLAAGETLTAVTAHLAERFGVKARVLPMTDDPVRTMIDSDAGTLAFQEYFVRDRCTPAVRAIRYEGAPVARLTPQVKQVLSERSLAGVIICPSNPLLSVDPILAVPGLREAITISGAPVVAVTPIVAGRALKGPTAKIMTELGITPDVGSIAEHYAGLIDAMIVDSLDARASEAIGAATSTTNTVMRTLDDKIALAAHCLEACERLVGRRRTAGPRVHAEAAR